MITVGVDLAAEPKGTALAVIAWSQEAATLVSLKLGVADDAIVEVTKTADKVGIDCALGWPVEFIEFLNRQARAGGDGDLIDGSIDARRRLAYRETDRRVHATTGRWPLSVSTDRLGLTAIRCAGLLSKMQLEGIEVDRSGAGKVVEVYPGAALRIWGFETKGYRTSADIRRELLAHLKGLAPWFSFGPHIDLIVESCDAFDAVIAALATRAAALNLYEKPSAQLLAQAKIEGWIALPALDLTALIQHRSNWFS